MIKSESLNYSYWYEQRHGQMLWSYDQGMYEPILLPARHWPSVIKLHAELQWQYSNTMLNMTRGCHKTTTNIWTMTLSKGLVKVPAMLVSAGLYLQMHMILKLHHGSFSHLIIGYTIVKSLMHLSTILIFSQCNKIALKFPWPHYNYSGQFRCLAQSNASKWGSCQPIQMCLVMLQLADWQRRQSKDNTTPFNNPCTSNDNNDTSSQTHLTSDSLWISSIFKDLPYNGG